MPGQRQRGSGGKTGRQGTARRTKPSRVKRRRSLGASSDRGPCRARRKARSLEGVMVDRGMGGRVLAPATAAVSL